MEITNFKKQIHYIPSSFIYKTRRLFRVKTATPLTYSKKNSALWLVSRKQIHLPVSTSYRVSAQVSMGKDIISSLMVNAYNVVSIKLILFSQTAFIAFSVSSGEYLEFYLRKNNLLNKEINKLRDFPKIFLCAINETIISINTT